MCCSKDLTLASSGEAATYSKEVSAADSLYSMISAQLVTSADSTMDPGTHSHTEFT